MAKKIRFEKGLAQGGNEDSFCPECGSVLGHVLDLSGDEPELLKDAVCPAPFCSRRMEHEGSGGEGLLPGADPSLLYRARALIFVPDGEADGKETGTIRALRYEEVHDPVARHRAKPVVTEVVWPDDRKAFSELFSHHVHHEKDPHVTPLNDGWDRSRPLPVL